jgi:hypothetical protein
MIKAHAYIAALLFTQILAGEWFDDPDKAHGRKKKSQNQELLVRIMAELSAAGSTTVVSCQLDTVSNVDTVLKCKVAAQRAWLPAVIAIPLAKCVLCGPMISASQLNQSSIRA